MGLDGLLLDLLEGLPAVASAVQIIALAYVIRALAALSKEMSGLHEIVGQQTEMLGPEDPAHPGARLHWAVGLPALQRGQDVLDEKLGALMERQRVIGDRQRDFIQSITELKDGQKALTAVATRAISQREHLVG